MQNIYNILWGKKKKTGLIGVAVIIVVILAIYSYQSQFMQAKELTGEERAAVLQYADPIADNILNAFNDGDYTRISGISIRR